MGARMLTDMDLGRVTSRLTSETRDNFIYDTQVIHYCNGAGWTAFQLEP
jgi:hypothetical protein